MSVVPESKVSMFGMEIDRVTLGGAVSQLFEWIDAGDRECRYAVTPNLDHVVQYQEKADLRAAYQSASLVLADGWPLVTASRLFRDALPERVAGSDLVPALFSHAQASKKSVTVFLLGAATGVGEIAAEAIQSRWSCVNVVGTYSPPLGFEHDAGEVARIRDRINSASPDILVVGLGAPKQELWLAENHASIKAGVAIAGGASIDFLAGRQKRAPRWMQRMNLEWSHRLMSHPRRLSRRYLRDAVMLPRLLMRERKGRSTAG
jgi:N-acetylglucosaminyldiphosphoundecaprenol N-acetyl-beta-D-mannosaminyltransferase